MNLPESLSEREKEVATLLLEGKSNKHELFYTFQGLTADSRHVVSVVMPVNHPSLPENADVLSQSEMEAIWADSEYYANMTASLSAEPDGSFSPDLAALDALVTSLRIDR